MKDTLSCGICIAGIAIITCVTCCVIILAIPGLGYWAHQIDSIRGHNIRCDKEFDATIELIVNQTVRVIVGRESYVIDSLPAFNITAGSTAIVYSSCEYSECESRDQVEYTKEFWWNPPKADTNCSSSINIIIVLPISVTIMCVTGIFLYLFVLCCINGFFYDHYAEINDELEIEERYEKAKKYWNQRLGQLKQHPQSMKPFEEI